MEKQKLVSPQIKLLMMASKNDTPKQQEDAPPKEEQNANENSGETPKQTDE